MLALMPYPLDVDHEILKLSLEAGLGLLESLDLGVGSLGSLLGLVQFGLEFASG